MLINCDKILYQSINPNICFIMGNQLYEIPQENTFEHSATTN